MEAAVLEGENGDLAWTLVAEATVPCHGSTVMWAELRGAEQCAVAVCHLLENRPLDADEQGYI